MRSKSSYMGQLCIARPCTWLVVPSQLVSWVSRAIRVSSVSCCEPAGAAGCSCCCVPNQRSKSTQVFWFARETQKTVEHACDDGDSIAIGMNFCTWTPKIDFVGNWKAQQTARRVSESLGTNRCDADEIVADHSSHGCVWECIRSSDSCASIFVFG
jgi:hypothetical protein